jgi:prepilin-type N-terminal cleavage/methylation domain-containing protein
MKLNPSKPSYSCSTPRGFTLIELLVVISIIAVLMGLLIPAAGGAIDAAKKTQAKNDLVGICNALRAYNTEYGRFPEVGGGNTSANKAFMDVLLGAETGDVASRQNPRGIVFMEAPAAKLINDNPYAGISADDGAFYDPWGNIYEVKFDSDYDNEVGHWYDTSAGPTMLRTQAIARSIGKDKKAGSGNKKAGDAADDVISWQ